MTDGGRGRGSGKNEEDRKTYRRKTQEEKQEDAHSKRNSLVYRWKKQEKEVCKGAGHSGEIGPILSHQKGRVEFLKKREKKKDREKKANAGKNQKNTMRRKHKNKKKKKKTTSIKREEP